MEETNGAVSIANTSSITIVDHCSRRFGHCQQTSDPSGQVKAVIRLQYDEYKRNGDIMDANGFECNAITATVAPTAQPNSRDRESSQTTRASNTGSTGSTSKDSVIAFNVGRGKHRLNHKKTAARADRSAYLCTTLAAPVIPVCEREASNSAFDNKAFSCDGDSVDHRFQTPNINRCLQTNQLSVTPNERNLENCNPLSHTSSHSSGISDQLICDNNSYSVISGVKVKNCFMKTNNESESTLKGQQYCSSSDTNRQIVRSRSTRSARSSVVKHIGVFYSDLCDVIKAMRSGTQTNSNHNIDNNCNNNNNTFNGSTTSSAQPHSRQTSATNSRTTISGEVLLQNEHLKNSSAAPVPPQPQTTVQYPIQPPLQAITCLQSNPISSHLMAVTSSHSNIATNQSQIVANESSGLDLPDILNSHLPPPPYSTLPPPGLQLPALPSLPPLVERSRNTPIRAPPPPPPPPPLPVAGRPPLPSRRILHSPTAVLAHCSRPNYLRPTCAVSETETSTSKACLSCNGVSIRWFILLIAFIGLLCAIIGTILGALRTTGREHLTLALLIIGVGIILITVSGIAWRLTSSGPTWRSILGLHDLQHQQPVFNGSSNDTSRRFVPRVPAPYGRTGTHHHPYGAMFYPEFQYRPPPPSYQASMQEYRLRLLLLDRSSSRPQTHPPTTSISSVSPPPTYRSSVSPVRTGVVDVQVQL